MGMVLSRLCFPGEVFWHYLLSLITSKMQRFFFPRQRSSGQLPRLSDLNSPGSRQSSNFDEMRFTFSGRAGAKQEGVEEPTPAPQREETCVDVQFSPTARGTLSTNRRQISTTDGSVNFNASNSEKDSVDDYDGDSSASSDYNDICIIEDPDFSQFGKVYENLVSPSDKQLGHSEPRYRCVSSLSPVKEEYEPQDMSSNADNSTCVSRLDETFPVFGEAGEEFTIKADRRERYESEGSFAGSNYGKRLLCCSLSSDSGIGERLRGSANTSTSDGPCLSTSDASDCNTSMRDLHNLDGSEGSRNEVFKRGEDSERPRAEKLEDHPTSLATSRPALAPLSIKARRKVTFLDNVLPASASPTGSLSPSPSPPSSSSSTSSTFLKNFRPVYSRQDSEESVSSSSSVESILALPLSPDSSCDGLSPSFLFPGTEKNYFAEPSEGSDLVLIVEGEKFYVHKSVVAWQCQVLWLHMQETRSREVVLPDKRAGDLLNFLYLLYPHLRLTITDRNLEGMLDLAHYLGCERVKRMCTTYLMGLAHFKHLCSHRHLSLASTKGNHADAVKGHHYHDSINGQDSSSGLHSNAFGRGSSACHFKYMADRSRMSAGSDCYRAQRMRTCELETNQSTSLCACADIMAERVMGILELAVKFELDDVYYTYLDVSARIRSDDITACPRYAHLSAAIREDILTSRITRLENVVSNLSVTRDDLIGCGRHRHENYRLSYNGELCLRCISRSLLREVKVSV